MSSDSVPVISGAFAGASRTTQRISAPPSYPCLLIQGCCTRAAVVCCCTVPRVLSLKTAVPALLQSAAAPMPERMLCCGLLLRYQMHGLNPHQCCNHFRWVPRRTGPSKCTHIRPSVATISVGGNGERGHMGGYSTEARLRRDLGTSVSCAA
jgi:hypothetical protein